MPGTSYGVGLGLGLVGLAFKYISMILKGSERTPQPNTLRLHAHAPQVGPHGPNRASVLMNPMYSIARTRQCPRKSCSPQRSSSYSAHPSGWYSYSSNSKDAGFIDAPMPISPHCIAAAHVQAPPSAGVGSRNGSCVGSVESNIKINLTAKHPHYKTN